MAGAPEFKIEVAPEQGLRVTQQPAGATDFSGATAHYKALESGIDTIAGVHAKIKAAQDQTAVAENTTEYLTELEKLERGQTSDKSDYKTAPKTFEEGQRELEGRLLLNVPQDRRATAQLQWRRAGLASGNRVHNHALTRAHDSEAGALTAISEEALRSAALATTPEERKAAVARYFDPLDASGWMSAAKRASLKHTFNAALDDADVVRDIRTDPRKALEKLNDPEQFKAMGPVQRQNRINEAAAKVDQLQTLEIQNTATRDPARAAATVGRVGGDVDSDAVFGRLVGPQAGGKIIGVDPASVRGKANTASAGPVWGDPSSPTFAQDHLTTIKTRGGKTITVNKVAATAFQGFLGELEGMGYSIGEIGGHSHRTKRGGSTLSQHAYGNAIDINPGKNPMQGSLRTDMPANISALAAKYGLSWGGDWRSVKDSMHFEYAGPPGAAFEPAPNMANEKARWRQNVARYDGQLAPAIAAYKTSPEQADKWQTAAQEKFGRYYTTEQFLTVVDDDKAKGAIAEAYKRADAPMDGGGLSPVGRLHAASAVHTAITQGDTARRQSINTLARVAREGDAPAKIFEAGFDVDPVRYNAWALTQAQAAENGDTAAGAALKEAEFQRSMLPFRQKAMRASPEDLGAFVESEDARLRDSLDVSIDDKNRLDVAKAVLNSVKEARDSNIIGLAEDAQIVRREERVVVPSNADPRTPEFQKAMALRGMQANAAVSLYGGRAIALKPNELEGFKARFGEAGANERFEMLKGFGATLSGQAYNHTVEAVVGKDPVLQFAGRLAASPDPGRADLAREILAGHALIKAAGESQGSNVLRAALAATLGGQIYPAHMQDAVVKAAEALAVGRAGTAQTLYEDPDQATREQAITDITGPIITRNGRVPVTPGVAPGAFIAALDGLTDEQLARMGGAFGRNGEPLSASDVGRYAVLKPLTPGSSVYVVGLPDRKARDGFAPLMRQGMGPEAPSPLTFDMRALAAGRDGFRPTVEIGYGGALKRATRQPVNAGQP